MNIGIDCTFSINLDAHEAKALFKLLGVSSDNSKKELGLTKEEIVVTNAIYDELAHALDSILGDD